MGRPLAKRTIFYKNILPFLSGSSRWAALLQRGRSVKKIFLYFRSKSSRWPGLLQRWGNDTCFAWRRTKSNCCSALERIFTCCVWCCTTCNCCFVTQLIWIILLGGARCCQGGGNVRANSATPVLFNIARISFHFLFWNIARIFFTFGTVILQGYILSYNLFCFRNIARIANANASAVLLI